MTKTLVVAALLSSFAAVSFAQGATADAASAPAKHMMAKKTHKMHKMRKMHKMHKPAAAASNPQASPDKKGGQ